MASPSRTGNRRKARERDDAAKAVANGQDRRAGRDGKPDVKPDEHGYDICKLLIQRVIGSTGDEYDQVLAVRKIFAADVTDLNKRVWQWIEDYHEKHGEAPTTTAFRRNYPAFKFVKGDKTPLAALVEAADKDILGVGQFELLHTVLTLHEQGEYDQVAAALTKWAEQPARGSGSAVIFTKGEDIMPEGVRWAWAPEDSDWIPADCLSLIAGRGDSGKSALSVWIAANMTRGTLPGCFYGTPRRVVWATLEASPAKEVVPRLKAAGADMSMIEFVHIGSSADPALRSIRIFDVAYISTVRKKIRADNVGLIVLDPLLDTLNPRLKDKEQIAVREALAVVGSLAEDEQLLIIGIAHFNKMSSVHDAVDRITGSAAFSQRLRCIIACAHNGENGTFVVSLNKHSWSPPAEPRAFLIESHILPGYGPPLVKTIRVRWLEDGPEHDVDDILAGKHLKDAETKVAQARALLLELLSGGDEVPKPDIVAMAEARGISEATLYRAWRSFDKRHSTVPEPGGHALWSLPGHRD